MPKFEREVEIDASVEDVWKIMIDPQNWPNWFPGMESVANVSALSVGGTFEWAKEGKTGQGTIEELVPLKRLKIITLLEKDKDAHVFELKPSGGFLGLKDDECKVNYMLDTLMGGGILGNFIAGGNPKDMLQVKKSMHQLRKLIESKTS
ncbi:MAG: SRPBCC family protein [Anaerolineaceae bacterium]|nr:SRPBCC family protein [Anaerolineaceae bacterium]